MADPDWKTSAAEIEAIVSGRHADPFAVLGLHQAGKDWVARAFVPGASGLEVLNPAGQSLAQLECRHEAGFFEGLLPAGVQRPLVYRARNMGGEWTVEDAYLLGPVLGPLDDYYIGEGNHLRLYDRLGAHPMHHEGHDGVHFAVWAPNASRVSVVGDFNGWDGRRHVMRKRRDTGVWEIFVPGAREGQCYKYELLDAGGKLLPLKSDPMGFAAEMRPKTASKVARTDGFIWNDRAYMAERRNRDQRRQPMAIYEVHLGSWRRKDDGTFLSYDELADTLIPYALDMGFTHIELLPVSEHPFDPSWGYQPTGLFAPTARFGDPAGFARFIDRAHQAGIGVILDWVPAHFPTDEHGLAQFDGTALYEHEDPRQGFHPDWNTAIYNFGRREVASFLLNNALFWLERYHVDGLRVDAVASMLYLDYSRQAGEWIPNEQGGRENLEAIAFLKRVNHEAYGQNPGIVMIAEESTAFPGVSQPTTAGGLGFGFKWNMGFMHDTLTYLKREPIHRKHHHNDLTFGLLYAFSENFVLPLSHDEVVHGKGSLVGRMPGDQPTRQANLRALYAYMWAHPGKKLLFMGSELAQEAEWSHERSLDWHLLEHPGHAGVQRLVREMNHAYRAEPALWEVDHDPAGFEWLEPDDAAANVLAFMRFSGGRERSLVCVANLSGAHRQGYRVGLPHGGRWRTVLDTDRHRYGGGTPDEAPQVVDAEPVEWHRQAHSAPLDLAPLSVRWLVPDR